MNDCHDTPAVHAWPHAVHVWWTNVERRGLMADRLVGIAEAARRLDLHPKRLQIMCREGVSPVKARKRTDSPKAEWVFSDLEISAYIEGLFADKPNEPTPG